MAETGGGSSTNIPEPENTDAVSAGNAADSKESNKARRKRMRRLSERKRRSEIRNCFDELQALMPHVTGKSDKNTIVGHAIDFIQSLEKTKAMLEKRKQELALARQAAAEAGASSSSAPPPPPQVAQQGTVAMLSVPYGCPDVTPLPLQQPLAAAMTTMSSDILQPQPLAVAAPAAPPQLPMAAAGQVGFQTWSWPNLVLNVLNDNAYINVRVSLHLSTQTMVMMLSVLNKYGIDVVTAQVASDDNVSSLFNIYARVTSMGEENPSSVEVYKLAMSEILVWLNSN